MAHSPISLLEDIRLKTQIELSEYVGLKTLLYENLFNKVPVIMNKILKNDIVFRTVPIYRKDITMGRKKYLSYRPIEYNYPYFNPCSEPEQRHFYCSTDRHLSIGESSFFLSEIENPDAIFDKDCELLEVGMWIATRDIYVADFRFGNFSHSDAEHFQADLKEKYNEFVKDEFIKDFFAYINRSFEIPIRKAEHLRYWLTACYSNYLFDDQFRAQPNWGTMNELDFNKDMHIDGLLYHSVKGIKTDPPIRGFNLALRTELIDSKALNLIRAGIFESKQIGEKEFTLDKMMKISDETSGDSWYYHDPTDEELSQKLNLHAIIYRYFLLKKIICVPFRDLAFP